MYLHRLLIDEEKIRIRIEFIENQIAAKKRGCIPVGLSYETVEEAESDLVDAQIELKEIHSKMRKLLLGE